MINYKAKTVKITGYTVFWRYAAWYVFNYSSCGPITSHITINIFVLYSVILKGKPPGTHFTEGNHKQSYTVFDRAGNKATCKFNIRVKGE